MAASRGVARVALRRGRAAERIGVAVYGAVIAGMLYSVLRYRGAYAAWFRFAALLFVFSDGVIAWSRFIGAVPGRTYVVMVPYYLAQCLFFCFADFGFRNVLTSKITGTSTEDTGSNYNKYSNGIYDSTPPF